VFYLLEPHGERPPSFATVHIRLRELPPFKGAFFGRACSSRCVFDVLPSALPVSLGDSLRLKRASSCPLFATSYLKELYLLDFWSENHEKTHQKQLSADVTCLPVHLRVDLPVAAIFPSVAWFYDCLEALFLAEVAVEWQRFFFVIGRPRQCPSVSFWLRPGRQVFCFFFHT